ncbi:hypothetical protein T439DRAFT_361049 [Meredithblackwellia eburnea MCA 4105]
MSLSILPTTPLAAGASYNMELDPIQSYHIQCFRSDLQDLSTNVEALSEDKAEGGQPTELSTICTNFTRVPGTSWTHLDLILKLLFVDTMGIKPEFCASIGSLRGLSKAFHHLGAETLAALEHQQRRDAGDWIRQLSRAAKRYKGDLKNDLHIGDMMESYINLPSDVNKSSPAKKPPLAAESQVTREPTAAVPPSAFSRAPSSSLSIIDDAPTPRESARSQNSPSPKREEDCEMDEMDFGSRVCAAGLREGSLLSVQDFTGELTDSESTMDDFPLASTSKTAPPTRFKGDVQARSPGSGNAKRLSIGTAVMALYKYYGLWPSSPRWKGDKNGGGLVSTVIVRPALTLSEHSQMVVTGI